MGFFSAGKMVVTPGSSLGLASNPALLNSGMPLPGEFSIASASATSGTETFYFDDTGFISQLARNDVYSVANIFIGTTSIILNSRQTIRFYSGKTQIGSIVIPPFVSASNNIFLNVTTLPILNLRISVQQTGAVADVGSTNYIALLKTKIPL